MTPLWRRPIWILGHLIALTAVLVFVRAGVWQLDRLDQKKDRNREIAARSDGPAVDVEDVAVDDGKYQHVTAHGVFTPGADVLIPYRTYEGNVGAHVMTPLVLDDGMAVLVNRGWIPVDTAAPAAPTGEVDVDGILLTTQDRRQGVDVDGVAAEAGVDDPYPLWLQQYEPAPDGDYPVRLPPPARDEGPHLSYAIQWFLFTGVVLIGYPLLLRRRMRADRGA